MMCTCIECIGDQPEPTEEELRMSADRELLESAARAAGFPVKGEAVDISDSFIALVVNAGPGTQRFRWNPLADDGDALRLAVRLQLSPLVFRREQRSSCVVPIDGVKSPSEAWVNGDAMAATRRAIVRAAAAMEGRAVVVTTDGV